MNSAPHFFDSIGLSRQERRAAGARAASQEQRIRGWFESHPDRAATPSEIRSLLFPTTALLTSVRRAMTVLTKANVLERLDEKRPGPCGMAEHTWRLRRVRDEQGDLFGKGG